MKVIKEWKEDQGNLKQGKLGTYQIAQIPSSYCYAASMLSRLYAKPNTTRFSVDWVPLIDAIVNSLIFNCENILSDSLTKHIT